MPPSIQFTSSSTTISKPASTSIYARPQKRQKMSITQTYFLAHSARGKLSKEASRSDHDLRLLVGHANLLDSLMIDLASAEQEQERWFTTSVSGAKAEEAPSHQWAETVIEEPEADWEPEDAESTDNESDYDDDEAKAVNPTVITTTTTTTEVVSDEDEEDDEDEEISSLTLTRTPSRHSPPGLSADVDSDSEDENTPPSPPQPTFDRFSEKQRQAIATTSFYDKKESALSETEQETFAQEGYYLPSRQPAMIAAY